MAKSKTIRATPNVLKCAKVLREALMPHRRGPLRLSPGEDPGRYLRDPAYPAPRTPGTR